MRMTKQVSKASMPGHPPTVIDPPSHVMPARVAGQGSAARLRYRDAGVQPREMRRMGPASTGSTRPNVSSAATPAGKTGQKPSLKIRATASGKTRANVSSAATPRGGAKRGSTRTMAP